MSQILALSSLQTCGLLPMSRLEQAEDSLGYNSSMYLQIHMIKTDYRCGLAKGFQSNAEPTISGVPSTTKQQQIPSNNHELGQYTVM